MTKLYRLCACKISPCALLLDAPRVREGTHIKHMHMEKRGTYAGGVE